MVNPTNPKETRQSFVSVATMIAMMLVGVVFAALVAVSGKLIIPVGLVGILLAAVVATVNEAIAIRLLLVMLFFQGMPAYFIGYLPAGTLFADDLVMLVFAASWLLRTIHVGRKIPRFGRLEWLLVLLGGFVGLSALLNRVLVASFWLALWQIAYLWPIGYIASSAIRTPEAARRMVRFVWRLGWVQVGVIGLEWIVFFLQGYGIRGIPLDFFGGTLGPGGAHILGIWIGMMIVMAAALGLHHELPRRQVWISVFAFMFVLVSSSTRQMYVILPVAMAAIFFLSPLPVAKRLGLAFIISLALLLFFTAFSRFAGITFNYKNLVVAQQIPYRLGFMTYSWELITDSSWSWLGYGPGSYASTAGLRFGAPLARSVAEQFAHDPNMVSATQWPVLLVEYGLVGTLLFLLLYAVLLLHLLRIYRQTAHPLTKSLSLAATGAILIYLASGLAGRSFEYQIPSIHVWLFSGLATGLYAQEKRSCATPEL